MIGLVQIVSTPALPAEIPRRMWFVIFSEGESLPWWSWFFRRGFRHVRAAAFYADAERWVYVNPGWRGTVLHVWRSEQFDYPLGDMLVKGARIVRYEAGFDRGFTPATFHCVGAIKALLGLRTAAVTPYGLYRALLRAGADDVTPCVATKAAVPASSGHEQPTREAGLPGDDRCPAGDRGGHRGHAAA